MKTEIYYFSATGNFLYVARELKKSLSAEIFSIAERIRNQKFDSKAEKIGFVFPQHYYGLPILVEQFAKKLQMSNVKYLFAIATCGVPYIYRLFTDLNEIIAEKIATDWRIKVRYWIVDRKSANIAKSEEKINKMIRYIFMTPTLFEMTDEEIEAIVEDFKRFEEFHGMKNFKVCRNLGLFDKKMRFVLTADFNDKNSFENFVQSQIHIELSNKYANILDKSNWAVAQIEF